MPPSRPPQSALRRRWRRARRPTSIAPPSTWSATGTSGPSAPPCRCRLRVKEQLFQHEALRAKWLTVMTAGWELSMPSGLRRLGAKVGTSSVGTILLRHSDGSACLCNRSTWQMAPPPAWAATPTAALMSSRPPRCRTSARTPPAARSPLQRATQGCQLPPSAAGGPPGQHAKRWVALVGDGACRFHSLHVAQVCSDHCGNPM